MHPYLRLELRQAVFGAHVVLLPIVILLCALGAVVVPLFPPGLVRFIERAMHLRGAAPFVLFNVYLLLHLSIYWLGAFRLLRVYVHPAEERFLPICLAKPMTRLFYLGAQLLPVGLSLLAFAGLAALGGYVSTRLLIGPLDAAAYAAGSALVITAALMSLGLLNLVYLYLPDTQQAVAASFLIWLPTILPFQIFVYRPALFERHPGLADVIVYPANLLWHAGEAPALAALLVPLGLLLLGGLALLAARRLRRMDI